ncbi:zinc finger, CCHC-type containing protein [Tanacetum coccineum]
MKVENQLGKTIKVPRSNRGGEYISQEFKDYLKACEIAQQLTPPYTPQHNEVSERRNRTLLDMVWGCEALVKRDTPDKLQQRYVKCIFIGYPKETMGYYFYFPPENKIVVTRYAEFLEKNLLSQEVSGRAEELEEIQDNDTPASKNTSKIPMEVEGFEPPQEEVVPVRRSARTHRAPNRLYLNVEVDEHSLGNLNEPNNYKAAILDSESDKCVDAMNAKMQSMKDNQVWCLVDLPPNWEAAFILGIKIYQDRSKRLIGLSQIAYMDKILKRFRMDTSKRGYIPMQERLDLNRTQGASTPEEVKQAELRVDCYCDAGFETDRDDIKSQMGYVFVLNGGAVDRKSSKQCLLHKVNNIATTKAAMEAVWIRKFISGLGEINLSKVHIDDNLADPFTKALSKGKLTQHARSMGLRLASSFM